MKKNNKRQQQKHRLLVVSPSAPFHWTVAALFFALTASATTAASSAFTATTSIVAPSSSSPSTSAARPMQSLAFPSQPFQKLCRSSCTHAKMVACRAISSEHHHHMMDGDNKRLRRALDVSGRAGTRSSQRWSTTNLKRTRQGTTSLIMDSRFHSRVVSPQLRTFSSSSSSPSSSALFMSAGDDDDEMEQGSKTLESVWDVSGFKKEVQRQILRSHKKTGKTIERLQRAKQQVEELATNPNASLEELEKCPNVDEVQFELDELHSRLEGLRSLEQMIQSLKNKQTVLPAEIASLAMELGVDDQPPSRPARGPSKPKGPSAKQVGPRLPYRKYFSVNKVEIRVGKQATDNDDLTLRPEHRDNNDWWMHASGCAGSHVVIRTADLPPPQQSESALKEVFLDAAALAARHSKCNGSVIKVSLTKCRDIKKPPGAKAGLVMLTGGVKTVSVNMKDAEKRLKRLDETVLYN